MERVRPAVCFVLVSGIWATVAGPLAAYSGRGQELFNQAAQILSQGTEMQTLEQLETALKALKEAERLTTSREEADNLKRWMGTAYNNQAFAMEKAGDFNGAIWVQKEAMKYQDENAILHHNLGRYYRAAGDYYNAGLSFSEARDLATDDEKKLGYGSDLVEAYMKLGYTGDGRGFEYAAQEVDKLLQEFPDEGGLYSWKATALNEMGEEERAKETLEEAKRRGVLSDGSAKLLDQISSATLIKTENGFVSENGLHFVLDFKQGDESERWARFVMDTLESAYSDLGAVFQLSPGGKVQVTVYFDADYAAVTKVAWSAGTHSGNRITLRLNPDKEEAELKDTIYHEYAHHLISLKANDQDVPAWLNEGYAMHQEPQDKVDYFYTALKESFSGSTPRMLSMTSLTTSFSEFQGEDVVLAYAHGYDMVEYFIERFQEPTLLTLLTTYGQGGEFADAFRRTTSMNLADFEKEWQTWRQREFEEGRDRPRRLQEPLDLDNAVSALHGMER